MVIITDAKEKVNVQIPFFGIWIAKSALYKQRNLQYNGYNLGEGTAMIFYFTGTGNSLYIAKELDEEIISIPQVIKQERLEFAADSIGIVCPVYGHEMPGMVKEFINKASL